MTNGKKSYTIRLILWGGVQFSTGSKVCEPKVFDYIDGDSSSFEAETLKRIAQDGQLMAYRHHGYWQCMDTLREKELLEDLWKSGKAPWKIWD